VTASTRGRAHVGALMEALVRFDAHVPRLVGWGAELARALTDGGRLLAAGNGGSAAQAQHLTAELVGRYRADDRQPLSALALHAETSSITAIANDFGLEQAFARQVRAHGRAGDVLLALSTSGESPNVLAAAEAGIESGLTVWALTGPAPNTLADIVDDVVAVEAPTTATVQEVHQVAIHLICEGVEAALAARSLRVGAAEWA
jgi:D-sedoheptulose 7-phosphate isomerase